MTIFEKERLSKSVNMTLHLIFLAIKSENSQGFFDSNRSVQDFFREFLSILLRTEDIVDLDKKFSIPNHPAIDLGSLSLGTGFQVTSQTDSWKIRSTIEKFIEYKQYESYSRLVFIIIWEKIDWRATYSTNEKFVFSKKDDIWDESVLFKKVESLEFAEIEKIDLLLKEKTPDISKLFNTLSPTELRSAIEYICSHFGIGDDAGATANDIPNRSNPEFMERKNGLNLVSEEIYEEHIKKDIVYNGPFNDFLSDQQNRRLTIKYFACCSAISKRIQGGETLLGLLDEVRWRMPRYESGATKVSSAALEALLHNMYFSCDIGINPIA